MERPGWELSVIYPRLSLVIGAWWNRLEDCSIVFRIWLRVSYSFLYKLRRDWETKVLFLMFSLRPVGDRSPSRSEGFPGPEG